ncbi:MAG: Serine/threonine phosphatase stp [Firmicutes bacterium ADurb.Bin248]|nr:MAG: Serine/threonine phosphatase stp [Firmicutes bacterium ADurb.Bin248]HOG01091.1 Stp1/IreP family PP2C-type Ser/Thr phosphatase [Clostridia bacterium]HPK16984.1 Stp1/IreP family PP2C-type Ser/Thr phosphatase [Clostridia bacterium]
MRYASKSVTGVRAQNQDAVFVPRGGEISLAVVADGMGGQSAGDIASSVAVGAVVAELKKGGTGGAAQLVSAAMAAANAAVYEKAASDPALRGMGTTMVLALLFNSHYIAANVGDSRLYHISGENIEQITKDHSYVAELVALGYITRQEAARHPRRNLITRALGTRESERVDIFEREWAKGDRLVLCSDGLYSELDEQDILHTVLSTDDMQSACEDLVDCALYSGSRDNVSIVIVSNEEAKP